MVDNERSVFDATAWISRYLLGCIPAEEEERLRQWLEESPHHREMFETLCGEDIEPAHFALYAQDNWGEAYRLFLKQRSKLERKRKIVRWSKYAALLVLLLSVGSYFWWNYPDRANKEEMVRLADVRALHLPVITLADGKEVVVQQAAFTLEDSYGTQVAVQDSDGLVYSVSSDSFRAMEYHTLRTPAQCDYSFVLSDGTKVWVNAKTLVKYPVVFSEKERVIEVKGEVYLEVAREAERPFYVLTDDVKVKVLGTSFNVKSYEDDSFATVTLVEGKVMAEAGSRAFTLRPCQQMRFDRTNGAATVTAVEVKDIVAWKSGTYVFNGERLEEVCKVLRRWYDVEILFERPEIAGKIYTGIVFKEEKIDDFIRNLNASSGYRCRYENGKLYIR